MSDSRSYKNKSGLSSLILCLLFIILLVSFIIVSLIGCKDQNSTKEQSSLSNSSISFEIIKKEYELREKCGSYCIDYFRNVYRDKVEDKSSNYNTYSDYISHYNKNVNRCYMLVKSRSIPKKNIGSLVTSEYIIDVHENKTFGEFTISRMENVAEDQKNKFLREHTISGKEHIISKCKILDKNCKSKDDWDKFIKPYMDE